MIWSLVRRRVTRRLTRLQTMYNVLKFRKNDEIMSTNQFTGTATQPQCNRKFCQFNKDQYCNTMYISSNTFEWIQIKSIICLLELDELRGESVNRKYRLFSVNNGFYWKTSDSVRKHRVTSVNDRHYDNLLRNADDIFLKAS